MYKGLYFALAVFFCVQLGWGQSEPLRQPPNGVDESEILKEFDYPAWYDNLSETLVSSSNSSCLKFEVKFRTDYPNNPNQPIEVDAVLYISNLNKRNRGPVPMVIQLPPMGGMNILDRWMGQDFCSRNIASFIIRNDFTGFDDENAPPVADHDHAFRRTVAAVKASMAYGQDHAHIDGEKLGLFGVSLGGILGSLVYGVEDNLSSGYFLVSGSDVPYILAYSEQERVRNLRQIRMREENFSSQAEYENYLRSHVFFDPALMAHRPPTETLNLVISKNDENVPTSKQFELQLAFGEPNTKYSTSGHAMTVIDTLLWRSNRDKIISFYQKRFELENPRQVLPVEPNFM